MPTPKAEAKPPVAQVGGERLRRRSSAIEKRLDLGQSRPIAHGRKQVATLVERLAGSAPPEPRQAASVAEQGVRMLGNAAELAPAFCCLRVQRDSTLMVPGDFGDE